MEHVTTTEPQRRSSFATVKLRRAAKVGEALDDAALTAIGKATERGRTSVTDDFESHILEGAKIVKKYWDSYQNEQAALTRKKGIFGKKTEQVTHELMLEKFGVLQRNAQKWLDTREKKGEGDTVRQAKTKACQDFIETARLGIEEVKARQVQARLGAITDPTAGNKAAVLIDVYGCKPPAEKGQSDSFKINGVDGKPAYFFKPVDGEAYPGYGWPEGGGAPREALCSKMGELLLNVKSAKGDARPLDIRFPKAEVAQLQDESFRLGSISQKPTRTGVLLEAIKGSLHGSSSAQGLFEDRDLPEDEKIKILKSIDKSQCKDLSLSKFITLDVDANKGNFIVQEGADSGSYGMTGFDAGRMFPSKAAVRAGGLGAMTAASYGGKNVPPDPNNPSLERNGSFLMMLPSAAEPFDDRQIEVIKALDAGEFVRDLKQANDEMGRQAPEMANKVPDECLELTKKSIKFLQQAVDVKPPLSVYEISLIYATGFAPIVDAADNERAIDQAVAQVLLDMQAVKGKGGEISALGIEPESLTLQQQADLLRRKLTKDQWEQEQYQNLLATWPALSQALDAGSPELAEINATTPFSSKAYQALLKIKDWQSLGGDPELKRKLAGNDKSYQTEVKQSAGSKAGNINFYNQWVQLGGTVRFKQLLGDDAAFDAGIAGKGIVALTTDFEELLRGGDPYIKTSLTGNTKTYEAEWKLAKLNPKARQALKARADEWAKLGGATEFKKLLKADGRDFKDFDGKPLAEQMTALKKLKAKAAKAKS